MAQGPGPTTAALALLQDPEIQRLYQIYFSGGTKQGVNPQIQAPRGPSLSGGSVASRGGSAGSSPDLKALGKALAKGTPSPGQPGAQAEPPPGVPTFPNQPTSGPGWTTGAPVTGAEPVPGVDVPAAPHMIRTLGHDRNTTLYPDQPVGFDPPPTDQAGRVGVLFDVPAGPGADQRFRKGDTPPPGVRGVPAAGPDFNATFDQFEGQPPLQLLPGPVSATPPPAAGPQFAGAAAPGIDPARLMALNALQGLGGGAVAAGGGGLLGALASLFG